MFRKGIPNLAFSRQIVAVAILSAAIVVCAAIVLPTLREFLANVSLLAGIMTPLWLIPVLGTE